MSVRLRHFASFVTLATATLAGCGDPAGPGTLPDRISLPRDLSAAEVELLRGSNRFAFDLLREVVTDDTASNVFLSPLSASMALGMTMNGTAGETWTQMRDVLGFDGMGEQAINEGYRDLIALLLDLDPKVEFGIGNSIWAKLGFPFHQAFYDRVATHFDAEARAIDFADPGAVDIINGWVADVTHDRITDLLDAVPAEAIMYLINAVYFNGDWRHQFDPDRTVRGTFTRADGSSVMVDMMAGEVGRRVLQDDGVTGVELPYGGDAFAAVALLPPRDVDIRAFAAGLDHETWDGWMAIFAELAEAEDEEEEGMLVRMPKLEIEYGRSMGGDLQDLGMTDAFDWTKADFSRLTPEPGGVHISRVKQQTFLKVDEEGTEAAAATAVEVRVTSASPSVHLDRPFVFAIRERLTGTILFLGIIGDPAA